MTVRTLLVTQLRDMVRNPILVVFWATTVAVGGVMALLIPDEAFSIVAGVVLMMAAYFVGWNIPAMTLVEEREKRVLNALLSTPVRLWQLVAVKGLLATGFSLIFGLVMLLLLGRTPADMGMLLLGYLLVTLFTVSGGTLMGLLFKEMRMLSAWGSPVILALMFATTLPWEHFRPDLWDAQRFLPTRPAMELVQAGYLGREVPLLQDGLIMLTYTALLLMFCIPLMRRITFSKA